MRDNRTANTQINRTTIQENKARSGSRLKPLLLVASTALLILGAGCSNAAEASHSTENHQPHPSATTSPEQATIAPSETSTEQPSAQPTDQAISEPTSTTAEPSTPGQTVKPEDKAPSTPDKAGSASIGEGSGEDITAIGDSVILDAAPYLDKLLPGIVVDGKVGRQMTEAQDTIDSLAAEDRLGDQVIIELGTNGSFNKKVLRSLLESLKDVEHIYLVNTRVPRQWQDTVNSDLTKVAEEFSNASVIDWYTASKGKDDFFSKDGVHLNREGAEFYADLLVQSIQGESA